jgi:hypothetical protein
VDVAVHINIVFHFFLKYICNSIVRDTHHFERPNNFTIIITI